MTLKADWADAVLKQCKCETFNDVKTEVSMALNTNIYETKRSRCELYKKHKWDW